MALAKEGGDDIVLQFGIRDVQDRVKWGKFSSKCLKGTDSVFQFYLVSLELGVRYSSCIHMKPM